MSLTTTEAVFHGGPDDGWSGQVWLRPDGTKFFGFACHDTNAGRIAGFYNLRPGQTEEPWHYDFEEKTDDK